MMHIPVIGPPGDPGMTSTTPGTLTLRDPCMTSNTPDTTTPAASPRSNNANPVIGWPCVTLHDLQYT